jgi:hypothetical protein
LQSESPPTARSSWAKRSICRYVDGGGQTQAGED